MDTIAAERYRAMLPKKGISTVEEANEFLNNVCKNLPDLAVKLPLPPSVVTKNKRELRAALRELNKQRDEIGMAPHRLIDTWENDFIIAISNPDTSERQKQELGIWRDIKFRVEEIDLEEWNGPSVNDILRENQGLPPLKINVIEESKVAIEEVFQEDSERLVSGHDLVSSEASLQEVSQEKSNE